MDIFPTDVWLDGSASLKRHAIGCYWYIEQNFDAGETHESEESMGGYVAIAREYSVELGIVLIEGNDSQGCVGGGKETDDDRRQEDDGIHEPGVVSGGRTTKIFVNVESMTLNDVVCEGCWSVVYAKKG